MSDVQALAASPVPLAAQVPQRDHRKLVLKLVLVVLLSTAFGFALVPLYDIVCRITGFNGRTNAMAIPAPVNSQVDTSRWVTVQFLSHTMPGVAITLKPEQFSMRVHPGEVIHTSYTAHNDSTQAFVGQAVPSVTPAVATPHLQKVECFCFTQQSFAPGEKRSMPVVFVIDPKMDEDLGTVTLSYTFFEAPKT